ncbi:hypothetical protein ACFFX0_22455 [Citricoccus parietis]|uniref:Uncharacterized protein n=1 Tax=Citricoccus parietis TaxID=592307 RepID=A0ABV5G4E8_9MICC
MAWRRRISVLSPEVSMRSGVAASAGIRPAYVPATAQMLYSGAAQTTTSGCS